MDESWGLDHASWVVLRHMWPAADVPVFELSLDIAAPPERHWELGRRLASLRDQGVLVVGSGNIVHNLGVFTMEDEAFDWAIEFDETAKKLISAGDYASLIQYQKLGPAARLAIPTNEHYLPLLYALALQDPQEEIHFFADRVTLGSISMRSLLIQ